MKKTTFKTILLFLIYALVLNPVSIVMAGSTDGLLHVASTKHCTMEGKLDQGVMNVEEASSPMKISDMSDCKCDKDCKQGTCGQKCNDCLHFFAGLPVITTELINYHSVLAKITFDLKHQLSMLMHYRPPISLHS